MTTIEECLQYYPSESVRIFAPDKYGTQLALLHETPTWICGLSARLSHNSWARFSYDNDKRLLASLIKAGDEHAKAMRGKLFFFMLTAPRFIWAEMDTYTVGRQPLGSTSTMHTECRALTGEDLVKAKNELKEGTLQTRSFYVSYHTMQRIIEQRRNHRLPHWHYITGLFETILEDVL